uniref:AAA family ATPase n=1 Tax=Thermococcus sp. TaxID=35749 RepID=UPI002607AA9D
MDREEMISRFAGFLRGYVDDNGNEVYINRLKDLLTLTPRRSLAIDWAHLNSFDPELAEELLENPEESIASAEDAIQIVLREPPLLVEREFKVHARFYNLPHTLLVKELGSEHINRLIQVEGIITRVSEVKPFVERAVFVCKDCGNEMARLQKPYENLVKPAKCDACGSKNIELDVEKSRFINFQSFRLQDRPESLKGGQMPRFVDAILLDDLVDTALPGDRVLLTGILRVILEGKEKRPIFKKVLEVNHIEQLSKEIEELEISPEDEQKIRELAKRKDIVDAIVDSIAPAIWGHKTVKKGIALALFGGVQRTLPDGTKLRGESHVLLVGDPGVAKSQILRYVANLAPRAIYTSGKSSSAAGLTAAAVRDEFTGSWVLEAGVLVLADGGFALIDEFDKMSDRDRSAIHEALEQQSYHHDFELLLADGKKVKIGELVDELIEENRDKVIIGRDTEILPVDHIELLAYDLERKDIVKVKADRVSRHKAPEKFIRIKFSNGREVTVTPEHPVMVWGDGKITEKPAEEIFPGDIALGVREYPIEVKAELRSAYKDRKDAENHHDYLYSRGIVGRITKTGTNFVVRETEREIPKELSKPLMRACKALKLRLTPTERMRFNQPLVKERYVAGILEKVEGRIVELERLAREDPTEALKVIPKSKIYTSSGITYNRFKKMLGEGNEAAIRVVRELISEMTESARKHLEEFYSWWNANVNFLRVKKVEIIPNDRWEWVYDVTVEP